MRSMKAPARTTAYGKRFALLLSPVLLLALAFAYVLFLLPAQYGATYPAALQDKMALLSRPTDKKRVITLGGSGAAFGQWSDLLESELPEYEVINFGLYGGLGTAPMLDLALPDIRPGDIVVISPEQNEQTLSGYFGARAMWQAADGMPGLLTRLKAEKQSALLGEALPFAAEKLTFWLSGDPPAGDGVYAREHLNAWGDVLAQGREGNAMPGGFDPDMPIRFDETQIAPAFIEEMNAFARACETKGARVYYRFCPMNGEAVTTEEKEKTTAYTAWLQEQLAFPLLGTAEESVLDSAWFFDTNFHLNAAGAQLNTALLARQLKTALGLPDSVAIALPTPPPALTAAAAPGDLGDADCFLYEEQDREIRLTGLTEAGKQKQILVLPGEINGLPVATFSPALFAGNESIQEITLAASIRRIENGSFNGCTNLKKLILMQESPGKTTVGLDLLQGTGCQVFVPAASYSQYQTNYFWAVHAARIRPETEITMEQADVSPAEQPVSGVMYADANGGVPVNGTETRIAFPLSSAHLRTNTPLGQNLFRREGFVPLCWNTASDGSGEDIPFGSRTDSEEGKTLYLRWVPQTPEAEILYEEHGTEAWVTGWTGTGKTLALPEKINGLHVTRVIGGTFAQSDLETVILPPSLFCIEQMAFADSTVKELWLYDSLFYIYEESFSSCPDLQTLHISAATSPRYSVSYFGAFADKLDWLRLHADTRKIILAGGSATRYAYQSDALKKAFPDYTPVNMGVYAYTNMLPQYRIMERFAGFGDVLISAPEFDTVKTQFCVSDALDERFWNMAEADYACVSLLDLRQYSQVFSSLSDFLHTRRMMTARRWEESPRQYDDDGNAVSRPTYNQYGDYILPRPNGDRDELLQTYRADYTVNAFPPETVNAINRIYREFQDKGVTVLFAYAPRNHSALTEESVPEAQQALDMYLREHITAPFLLTLADSLYPAQQCYLIDNHLSDEGVQLHMKKILPALTALLGAPSR